MNKIEVVKRAIERKNPPYVPIELWDVPFIYSAYGTINPERVRPIKGTENFDSLIVSYNWTLDELGKDKAGESLRRDEWGISYKIPNDTSLNYIITDHPLRGKKDISNYQFPSPYITEEFFGSMEKIISNKYNDRFISAYIDPGAFIIAAFLFGYDELFINLIDNLPLVRHVFKKVIEFQKEIVRYFKEIGAHMITYIDEVAGTTGMMISPDLFRKELYPYYEELFSYIHSLDMYTCCLFDGNTSEIIPEILALETDCVQFMEPNDIGIENIAHYFKRHRCIKASVDMRNTLAIGSPSQVSDEAKKLMRLLNTEKGGFIPIILRWHRPEYPEGNVAASVETFNKYRFKNQ